MVRKKKEETKAIETKKKAKNILLEEVVDVETIRKELKDYVDERVNQTFIDELDKSNKKLIREKNKKILWKNVVIVLLLLIIGFLVYLLYTNNYFDKVFNKENPIEEKENKENKEKETPKDKKEEVKEPSQEELKKTYAKLLDNYYVTDNSTYLVDFYDGKLTSDMMKYMTLNTFDFSTFTREEDYNIIKESTFKTMYEKLFNDDYMSSSFDYDDNKVRYVKQMDAYMTSTILVREESNIKREIKNIKVDAGEVIITTIEGIVKDGKLYNVITEKEIEEFKNDSLIKYEKDLNKLVYTFKDNKLISLSK